MSRVKRESPTADKLIEPRWQQMVAVFIRILEEKEAYTLGHSLRVRDLAVATARAMKWNGHLLEWTSIAAWLHDIGKIVVDLTTLRNQTLTLTPEQHRDIIDHPYNGAQMVRGIFPRPVQLGILLHHERYDGKVTGVKYPGYPFGWAGKDIHPIARVIAVVDTFDAMTSQRTYNEPLSVAQAIKVLRDGAGTRFDPRVISAFIRSVAPTLTKPASR